LAAFAALASSAQALPTTPTLSGTHPSSPGGLTKPRIYGTTSVVSTSVVHWPPHTSVAAPDGSGDPITIYALPDCAGPEVASGTAAELESPGLPVTVLPGSTTTFSATNSDISGVSPCSNDITYRQVSEPPSAPTVTSVSPASPANDNLPRVAGNAPAESTVEIYTNSSCSGGPVATRSASQFGSGGIQVAVADNSTTTFFARATWAELPSTCSSTSVSYQELTPAAEQPGGGGPATPPVTVDPPAALDPPGNPAPPRLRTSPGPVANDAMPLVTGSAPGAAAVRIYSNPDCKAPLLAKGSVAQLQAGLPVQIVPNTTIAFYGKAVDAGGNESTCSPQPAIYTDDSIAPQTRITGGPPVKTVKRAVVFRFADITGGPETSFVCKIDKKPWKPCQAPLHLKKLGHKRHTLRVKAYDAAGNREATGVKRSFQVVSEP
jgi:hypothetical protein